MQKHAYLVTWFAHSGSSADFSAVNCHGSSLNIVTRSAFLRGLSAAMPQQMEAHDVEHWCRNGSLAGSNIGAVDWSGKVCGEAHVWSDCIMLETNQQRRILDDVGRLCAPCGR